MRHVQKPAFICQISSVGYELTGIGSLDAFGAMLIAWLTFREGRESFGKAQGMSCSCSCACNSNGTETP
jgi:hypothetical protein